MALPAGRVAPDAAIPATTRVAVIGGGIIGVGAAFFLAQHGIPVALCEKAEIAGEQSSRNWAFPVFRSMRVAQSWGGMIDVTPDAIPVISNIDPLPGFFVATGFTGHGFGIAPGAGRLMAQMVAGQTPVVDPAPFRYSRVLDGTRP